MSSGRRGKTSIYPKDQQKKVAHAIATIEKNHQGLIDKMAELERQGITQASPWWREGKYFYLVHPQTKGQRKREYIGCDENRVKEALARMERYKQYQRFQHELESLRFKIGKIKASLKELYESLGITSGDNE